MRISGNEPSSVILSQTKCIQKLEMILNAEEEKFDVLKTLKINLDMRLKYGLTCGKWKEKFNSQRRSDFTFSSTQIFCIHLYQLFILCYFHPLY